MGKPTLLTPGSQLSIDAICNSDIAVQIAQKETNNTFLAVVQLIAGIALSIRAYNNYKKARDNIIKIQQCREDIACMIHDHNVNVIAPYQRCVLNAVQGASIGGVSYGGLCNEFGNYGIRSLTAAKLSHREHMASYCLTPSPCVRQLDYYAGTAMVDSSFKVSQRQNREIERRREAKFSALTGAHAATFSTPNNTFQLLNAAESIYVAQFNQATSNLSGGLALAGYGFGSLLNGLSSNG